MKVLTQTISNYGLAFKDLRKHRPLTYVIIPGLLTAATLYILYYISAPWAGAFQDWVSSKYPFETGSKTVQWLMDKFTVLLYFGGFIFLFKYILFIVMSPFMSLFSEDIEHDIESNLETQKFKLNNFVSDIIRGIRITLRNLWRELLIIILLFIISFIPGAQVITAPLIFIVQAYYAGFGNMDYTLERYYNVSQTATFVKRNKIMAIANGSIFLFILSIPVLGWFLAVPLGTSAATRSVLPRL